MMQVDSDEVGGSGGFAVQEWQKYYTWFHLLSNLLMARWLFEIQLSSARNSKDTSDMPFKKISYLRMKYARKPVPHSRCGHLCTLQNQATQVTMN